MLVNSFFSDLTFIVTVTIAAFIKVATSYAGFWQGVVSACAGIGCAFLFTGSIAEYLHLTDGSQQVYGVAGLLTITGEGLVRWLVNVSKDPSSLIKAFFKKSIK